MTSPYIPILFPTGSALLSLNHFVALQILETHNQVEEKKKLYLPYNILPLDPDSANQAIMRYPEVASFSISLGECLTSLPRK